MILAAILAIGVVIVLVLNSLMGAPTEEAVIKADITALALKGINVIGYDEPYNPRDPMGTAPTKLEIGGQDYFFDVSAPPSDAEEVGEIHDASGDTYKVYHSFPPAGGGGGGRTRKFHIDKKPVCGDGTCNTGEDKESCPGDCGEADEEFCGNHVCGDDEDCEICAKDCGPCAVEHCGDGECGDEEDCTTCPEDCGDCPGEFCGNGVCSAAAEEYCSTCPEDCGECGEEHCGDGVCDTEGGEDCDSCVADCGACVTDYCGDGMCNGFETCESCEDDCGPCCINDCSPEGSKRCTSGFTAYEVCGDYDEDDCLEWGGETDCGTGKDCSGGVCVADDCSDQCTPKGAKECVPDTNAYYVCGDYDEDICYEWGPAVYCGEGEVCEGGACVEECTSECTNGAKRCEAEATGYSVCADYNDDGCYEWGDTTFCGSGETCVDGACVSSTACQTDCTKGDGICHAECESVCKNFYKECDGKAKDARVCSGGLAITCCGTLAENCVESKKDCDAGYCVPCEDECTANKCVNLTHLNLCMDIDEDGCKEWAQLSVCGENYKCIDGECVYQATPCEDACTLNTKKCVGDSYVVCADSDSDGCTDWGGTQTACGMGQVCSSGECIYPDACTSCVYGKSGVYVDSGLGFICDASGEIRSCKEDAACWEFPPGGGPMLHWTCYDNATGCDEDYCTGIGCDSDADCDPGYTCVQSKCTSQCEACLKQTGTPAWLTSDYGEPWKCGNTACDIIMEAGDCWVGTECYDSTTGGCGTGWCDCDYDPGCITCSESRDYYPNIPIAYYKYDTTSGPVTMCLQGATCAALFGNMASACNADPSLECYDTISTGCGYDHCGGSCKEEPCQDECSVGERGCASQTVTTVCGDYNDDGCYEWAIGATCRAGEKCLNGQCVEDCSDECTLNDPRYCNPTKTGYSACGDFDADSCLEPGFVDCTVNTETCANPTCMPIGGCWYMLEECSCSWGSQCQGLDMTQCYDPIGGAAACGKWMPCIDDACCPIEACWA